MTPAPLRRLIRRAAVCTLVGWAALAPRSSARADDQGDQNQPPPSLEQSTSDDLQQKLQPLLDAKNWSGAAALLSEIIARVDPDSYDHAYVAFIEGKVYFETDDIHDAAACWAAALQLGEAHPNYFSAKDKSEMLLSLAQCYYELGSQSKVREEQDAYLVQATDYIKRWMEATRKPTPEVQLFYTSLLYSRAIEDEKHIDMGLVRQAEYQAQIGLRMSAHPSERFYQIIVACAQQSDDLALAAQYFELLVWKYPKNGQYWQNLWYCYMNLAASNEEKNPDLSREYYIRAINSLERAQSFGYMNKPRDNYNLFTLYYQVGQFGKATDLLYAGMMRYEDDRAAGVPPDQCRGIESSVDNWQHLASAYQQNDQPEKAVKALRQAEAYFPDEGALDLQMGEIYYYQLDDNAAAYRAFLRATSKARLDKPYQAWVFAAYTAYSLEKYPEAMDALVHAERYPDAARDRQLPRLKEGIQQCLDLQRQQAASAPAATP